MHHNPSLLRFPAEATIIGRMVLGFGELEFLSCNIAAKATGDTDNILKMLYSLRSTNARIESARLLMETPYAKANLADEQNMTMDAVSHCHKIRNQYAHCNWGDHHEAGLFFADIQDSAQRAAWVTDWKHVDVPLLERQESFFGDVRGALLFLEASMQHLMEGWPQNHGLPAPLALPRQPMHNLASQHIPPWLSEDLKALHKARALEAEQPATQPIRPPTAPRLTEMEWRAKCAKEVREGRGPVCR